MRKEYRKSILFWLLLLMLVSFTRPFYYYLTAKEPDNVLLFLLVISPVIIIYIVYGFRNILVGLIENKESEEKIAADKLKRSEAMLHMAQRIANVGYWEEFLLTDEINLSEELLDILEVKNSANPIDKKRLINLVYHKESSVNNLKKEELYRYGQIEQDFKITTGKGNVKYLFERITLIKENNAPYKIIGVVQDITERKLGEQKIIQSQEYYKSLFEGAKDAIILFYPDNEIVIDVNRRACEMYGFTKDEFIGMSIIKISKHPDRERKRVGNTLETRQYYHFKSTQFHKDGSELYLDITASVINYHGEEVILSINRDITESQMTEEKVRLLSMGIEQHPSPIVITNVEAEIEYVNRAFEQVTGYSFDEVKGKNPRILQSGETKKEVYEELWSTIGAGKEWRGEFKNRKKDGSLYWEMAVIYPIIDTRNQIKQYFANKIDITERKELEYQLKLYRERLEFLVEERTKRLRESEETFRALSESSMDVIMRFNENIEHIYANPAAEKAFGIPAGEIVGRKYSELNLEKNIINKWEEAVKKVFSTKTENMLEMYFPDGKCFDCRLYPEYDNKGKVVSVITSSRDISFMKQVEKDLIKKAILFEGVAEASNKLLSLDSFYVRINKALEIIGKAAEVDRVYIFEHSRDIKTKDYLMSQIYEWAAPGIEPQIDNPLFKKVNYKKLHLEEKHKKLFNGESVHFLVKEIPKPGRNAFSERGVKSVLCMPVEIGGVFWGFVGYDENKYERVWDENEIAILKIYASDIGGAFTRKLIEDALMNTEERFKALFDYAPIAYFIVDPEGYFIDVNNSLEKTIGYSKKEISEKKKIQKFIHLKEDKITLEKVLADSESGIPSESVEMSIFKKDGRKISIELSTFPIALAERKMVLCALHDISLRKETENEVRTALTHSQELNEIKTRFVSMVSHEFRTPLSTILSSVEILKLFTDRLKEEEKAGHYKKIAKSIDYLTNLLDDVITINRADSGRLNVKFKLVDIMPLLEQWIMDIKASYVETAQIIFEKTEKELKVEVDENLFRQIVSNLLNNAIKYTPANKKIIISVLSENEKFILKIADEGIGIPADSQTEVFNPFYRAVNTGNVPGSGLGLAVAKRSIESLHGEITLTSKENKGSTFIVTIPLKKGGK